MVRDEHRQQAQSFTRGTVNRRDVLVRGLGLGLSLGALGMFLASCGAESEPTLKFVNWQSAELATRDSLDKALAELESQNQIEVENIAIPFDRILQQVTSMLTSDSPPDVVELSGNWPHALGSAGTLADLGPFVSHSWRSDAFPNSFEVGTYRETLYAVPFSITPHGFWYNKELMAQANLDPTQPPATIDQLNQMLDTLRGQLPADTYPIGIDLSSSEYTMVGFWPWIWTFGGNPMIDDGQGNVAINWADDGTVAAFHWLQELVAKKWTPPDQAIKTERELMAFRKLVFKLDGPYLTGNLIATNPAFGSVDAVNRTFGVTATPVGPSNKSVTCADIHNLAIAARSPNKEQAWKLIEFLTTSKDMITTFLIPEGGVLPHRSDTTSGPYARFYADAISRAFIEHVIPTMRPPAYGPLYSLATRFIVRAMQDVAGGAHVRERLRQLTQEVQIIYDV